RQAVSAIEDPHRLDHRHHADEAGIVLGQAEFHDIRGDRRLHWVILREVANENVGIEPDHPSRARRLSPAAPSATALRIRSIETGRRGRGSMAFSAETGSLGSRTTVPSGWTKNFTRSPGFSRRCSRIAFGIVAWPLTVIADSMFPPLHSNKCNTTAHDRRQVVPDRPH